MQSFLVFIYWFLTIVIYIAGALMTSYAATQKGYSGGMFLALGFLTPVLSLIFVAALPLSWDERERERRALAKRLEKLLYEDEEE